MANELPIPDDLASLTERRGGVDRRVSGKRPNVRDRRASADSTSAETSTPANEPITLGDVAIPEELLERRREGSLRDR